jgi:hypothetical protein
MFMAIGRRVSSAPIPARRNRLYAPHIGVRGRSAFGSERLVPPPRILPPFLRWPEDLSGAGFGQGRRTRRGGTPPAMPLDENRRSVQSRLSRKGEERTGGFSIWLRLGRDTCSAVNHLLWDVAIIVITEKAVGGYAGPTLLLRQPEIPCQYVTWRGSAQDVSIAAAWGGQR